MKQNNVKVPAAFYDVYKPLMAQVSIAKEQNMNEYILKRILGHTIRDITEQIYTHRDNKTLLDAVNKLII